jgi:5-methylcytosine-specific restriction endonuclease McrA
MGRQKYPAQIRQEYLKQGFQPCVKCDQIKSISEFHKSSSSKTGYQKQCKDCARPGNKGKEHKYPTKVRLGYLKQGLQPCCKCDEIKPVSEFYKIKRSSTGYKTACKVCISGGTMKWTTRKRKDLLKQGFQPCSKCDQIRPLNWFTKDSRTSTGYNIVCKDCQKKFRQGDQYRESVRRYNNSDHYKSVVMKKYRNTGAHRKNNRKYQTTEKGRITGRTAQRKRRAKKRAVNESYTKADEQITYQVFGKVCLKCDSTKSLGIDHFYCLNDGYPLTITNAIPLCRRCNSSKGTKSPTDFFTEIEIKEIQGKFKKAKFSKVRNRKN